MKNTNIEWSLYWAQDRLHSCVAVDENVDQQALTNLWQELASSLDNSATVLDLATGNGAVPVALLGASNALKVTAVDKADIDPVKYLEKDSEILKAVTFLPNTDIENLTIEDMKFDVITSQYGVEYAELNQVAPILSGLLNTGGRLKFLMHHEASSILESSLVKLDELDGLLRANGVLDRLANFLQGTCTLEELESSAVEHQENSKLVSEHISGQVFAGIGTVLTGLKNSPKQSLELATTLNIRVHAERDRLAQMRSAALSSQDISDFASLIIGSGIKNVEYEAFYADQDDEKYLLGWLLQAVK